MAIILCCNRKQLNPLCTTMLLLCNRVTTLPTSLRGAFATAVAVTASAASAASSPTAATVATCARKTIHRANERLLAARTYARYVRPEDQKAQCYDSFPLFFSTCPSARPFFSQWAKRTQAGCLNRDRVTHVERGKRHIA